MKHGAKTNIKQFGKQFRKITTTSFYAAIALALTIATVIAPAAQAAGVKQVATGFQSACAVVDKWVKCWGDNTYGQIGNGKTSTTPQSTPVLVANNKTATAATTTCTTYLIGFCTASTTTPAQPASPMAGKNVEKVSVGTSHACAIADAKLYCWGDNYFGQLGNRSTTDSSVPVAVDVASKDIAATSTTGPAGCGNGLFQTRCTTTTTPAKPKSALAGKEIIDVSAGDQFTCALASDGTVACWGSNDFGRLGTSDSYNYSYPKQIYNGADSAFVNKKGIKLAKASIYTMCVLAVDKSDYSGLGKGTPYCWGFGIGNDTLPANGRTTVACSKNSPTTRPTGTITETSYFWSSRPLQITGSPAITAADANDYVTGLGENGRSYYWGMRGYQERLAIVSTTSCSINPCSSNSLLKIDLAAAKTKSGNDASKKQKASAAKKAKASNTGGGDKKKNLNSNTTSAQAAQNAARGGVTSTVGGQSNIGKYNASGSYVASSKDSYSSSTQGAVGQSNSAGAAYNVNNYQGVARPSGSAFAGNQTGGSNGSSSSSTSCSRVTHYGYTADRIVTEVGKMSVTVPTKSGSLATDSLTTLSGNVQDGLFCANKTSGGAYCDTNGGSMTEGQTGSNYTKQCTTTGTIFKTTTCAPPPTGPQQVVTTGWLNGKTIKNLNTGISGYTCALANGGVGCWGVNTMGQLGNGSTTNKLVPTAVSGM